MADSNSSTNNARDGEQYYVISVAAELTGMHAQTLRTYDRLGLVSPMRTRGGGRRYSTRDITMLRRIQYLSQEEGVNLAGIKTIIELTERIETLEGELVEKSGEVESLRERLETGDHASAPATTGGELVPRTGGEIVHVPRSTQIVVWEPRKARRRREREVR